MSESGLPILIVGAGPTGLAAALELSRLGKKVRIIEAKGSRSVYSKALGINPRTLGLLTPSGAAEALIKAGRKAPGLRATSKGKVLFQLDVGQVDHPHNYLVILPQSDSERVLETCLNGFDVKVERNTSLKKFTQTDEHVKATIETKGKETEVKADFLIGADGSHSTVRKTLGLNFPGDALPEDWSLSDIIIDGPVNHEFLNVEFREDRLFLTIPIRENLFRVVSNKPNVLENLPKDWKVKDIPWQSDFTISHRLVEKYQVRRVFLAGDAAHIHSPLGGRGMNLGVEDACALAGLLTEGGWENYSELRHKRGREVIKLVKTQTKLFTSDKIWPRFMVRQIMPLLLKIPPIRKRFLETMMGLR